MLRLTATRLFIGLLVAIIIGLAIAWLARKPIADAAIRQAIEARGVRASYSVKSIGLRWERIENLRIGDPGAPDLTADWAEIRVSAGLGGARLRAVRAGGVRLRGRIVNGRLTLGQVDKLLPKSDVKTPFALPDLDVDLHDARILIDSEAGQIASRIDGKGNLANGFAGTLAAISPSPQIAGCRSDRVTAYLNVNVRNREPTVKGPVRANAVKCGDIAVAKPGANLNATLNATLNQWRGEAIVEAQSLKNVQATLADITGRVSFDGTASDTRGKADLSARAGIVGSTRLSGLGVKGVFSTRPGMEGQGTVAVARLIPETRFIGQLNGAARSAAETPVGPLLAQLSRAVRNASSGINLVADVTISGTSAAISSLKATTLSGASLRISDRSGIHFGSTGLVADTDLLLSGGGFPTVQSTLQRSADGRALGVARIAPFVGSGSRVMLQPVRFAFNPSGAMRFETMAGLDGPINGGRVEGLQVPVNVTIASNGNIIINNGCTPLKFRTLSLSGLVLDPANLRLCPVNGRSIFEYRGGRMSGGALTKSPRFTGTLGGTRINLTASNARVVFGTNAFSAVKLSARLGGGDRLSTLDIESLSGRFANSAVQGRFSDSAGKIGSVPLLIGQASGEWAVRNGALSVRAGMKVSDEQVPWRFNPLTTDDAVLTLVNGQIAATATLREPAGKTEITKVAIAHNLSAGTGTARLSVADLRFGKNLQPEQLTPLTLGVVANVEGAISGSGDIRWGPNGVSSTGRFATQGLDFAAAFGPVSALKGTINFSDLLAMATPPGQQVTIASINPGTLVANGVISYQLLTDQLLAIEGGTWPFAGGDLILDPTVMNLGQEVERKLTFRVVGLDAAKFIQQLEFENLAASGTFDGIMPMYFDANGGRIEGGRLVVRQGGGTLAYVGEISNTAMNVYAKMAFDALKSIRYKKLTIELNGPLDGEIVSQINFNGINEAPLSPPKSFISRQFIGLPFVFNIKMTAPFRSLLNTARTIQDPSSLLQRTIPELRKPPVQTPESETKP
jgi:translocation and assembly module TamB